MLVAHHASRRLSLWRTAALLAVCAALLSCGKKGALTLHGYQKPSPPALLMPLHREDILLLAWSFPEAEEQAITGFVITRSTSPAGSEEISVGRAERSYADRGCPAGTTCTYTIFARNVRGMAGISSTPLSVTPIEPPPPPAAVAVTIGRDAATMRWEGPDDVLYNVYRRLAGGIYGSTPVNAAPLCERFLSLPLDSRRTVYYAVRALRDTEIRDEGPLSAETEIDPATFTPAAPRRLSWHAEPGRIVLDWDEADESWVTGYRVYRRTAGSVFDHIADTQLPVFTDTVNPTLRRDYRVTALGPVREGPAAEVHGAVFSGD